MNLPFKRWAGIALLLLGLFTLVILSLVGLHRKSAPHSATLTWQAPQPVSGVTIVGYNVYRRADEGAPFLKIATHVAGPPYEDRLVGSGRTYFYAVTSIDQDGRESRFSTAVSAKIP